MQSAFVVHGAPAPAGNSLLGVGMSLTLILSIISLISLMSASSVPVPEAELPLVPAKGIACNSLCAACMLNIPLLHCPVDTVQVFPVPQSALTLHAQTPAVHNVLRHSEPLLQVCPTAFAEELMHLLCNVLHTVLGKALHSPSNLHPHIFSGGIISGFMVRHIALVQSYDSIHASP